MRVTQRRLPSPQNTLLLVPLLDKKKLKVVLNPRWLGAHNKAVTSSKGPKFQEHIFISNRSSHPLVLTDDLESVYRFGDIVDDLEKTNELLHYFSQIEAGPSNLGRG